MVNDVKYPSSTRDLRAAFAALEFVIVLVIIVLLFAAYFQGREMMINRKVASIRNDCDSIAIAIEKYREVFGQLPGDDPAATTRFDGVWAPGDDGDGDGRIAGAWNDDRNSSEARLFWKHLRAAGLIAGPVDTSESSYVQPTSAFNSLIGVTHGMYEMQGLTVVFGDIPAKILRRFDERTDDGRANAGRVRARIDDAAYDPGMAYDAAVALSLDASEPN